MKTSTGHAVDSPELTHRSSVRTGVAAAIAFFLALLPIVLIDYDGSAPTPEDYRTRAGFDHGEYHLPVIRDFAAQLPAPDLSDYASATTPGYHLLMAAVGRAFSDDPRVLRAFSLLIGSAMIGLLVGALARTRGVPFALTRALPLAASLYVVSSAAWLLPDNAAWLCVLVIVLLSLKARLRVRTLALAGAVLIALVLVRQIHLWAAAPVWLAWWLGPAEDDPRAATLLPTLDNTLRRRAARAALAVVFTAPAFLLIGRFFLVWGGMTPPSFDERLSGPNLVVPATVLTLIAIYGAFFAGDWLPAAWLALRKNPRLWTIVLLGAIIGLALGVAPHSSYHFEDRISHLWNVVRRLPTLAERSPVIVLGSVAGGVTAALIGTALPRRDAWVFLAALAGFVASQTVGALAWPRYYEPLLLIMLALACARIAPVADGALTAPLRPLHAARTPLIILLCLAQLAVTVISLR